MIMKNLLYIFAFVLLISACTDEPSNPNNNNNLNKGAIILCEGLKGADNSSISVFDIENKEMQNNFFKLNNPNDKLGDIANDMVIHNDRAYIAVSNSHKIECIDINTGKLKGRIVLADTVMPRKLLILNDNRGYFTDLKGDRIIEFSPSNMVLTGREALTGPAPEGIAYVQGKIWVANSGYGDYRHAEKNAGYIFSYDAETLDYSSAFFAGKNPVNLVADERRNLLYINYWNLPSLEDSLGGIIKYNTNSRKIEKHYRLNATAMSLDGTMLFYIDGGVGSIETGGNNKPTNLISNNTADIWYTITARNNQIWIGNARDYISQGEIIMYEDYDNPQHMIISDCGVNPNKILFY